MLNIFKKTVFNLTLYIWVLNMNTIINCVEESKFEFKTMITI